MHVMYSNIDICWRMQAPDTKPRLWYCRVADIFAQMNNKMSGGPEEDSGHRQIFSCEIWKAHWDGKHK